MGNTMKLQEYMKFRNGVHRNGGIISAMTDLEFSILGITDRTNWAKKYKNLEISPDKIESLTRCAIRKKTNLKLAKWKIDTFARKMFIATR